MGDAYSDAKKASDSWYTAKLYCEMYFDKEPMVSGWTKESLKKLIYNKMGQRTPEELAKEIGFDPTK